MTDADTDAVTCELCRREFEDMDRFVDHVTDAHQDLFRLVVQGNAQLPTASDDPDTDGRRPSARGEPR